jgi:hypothetical protein
MDKPVQFGAAYEQGLGRQAFDHQPGHDEGRPISTSIPGPVFTPLIVLERVPRRRNREGIPKRDES